MPRRKEARRTTVRDIRTILRLTHEQGRSVREVSERLKISKTTVSTYVLRRVRPGLSGRCRRSMTMTRRSSGCCSAAPAVLREISASRILR
jgi:transposase